MRTFSWLGDRLFYLDMHENQQWIEMPYHEMIESVIELSENVLLVQCVISKYKFSGYRYSSIPSLMIYNDEKMGKVVYESKKKGITIVEDGNGIIIEISKENKK